MKEIVGLIQLIQEAIDRGTSAIQEVHESMVRPPYAILKRIPFIALPSQAAESLQTGITAGVYQSIREINRLAGYLAVRGVNAIIPGSGDQNPNPTALLPAAGSSADQPRGLGANSEKGEEGM